MFEDYILALFNGQVVRFLLQEVRQELLEVQAFHQVNGEDVHDSRLDAVVLFLVMGRMAFSDRDFIVAFLDHYRLHEDLLVLAFFQGRVVLQWLQIEMLLVIYSYFAQVGPAGLIKTFAVNPYTPDFDADGLVILHEREHVVLAGIYLEDLFIL